MSESTVKGEGLLLRSDDRSTTTVLLSIASVEQEFEKEYVCTSVAKDSMVKEVSRGQSVMHLRNADTTCIRFAKIRVRSINSLAMKIYQESDQEKDILFDIDMAFPSQS